MDLWIKSDVETYQESGATLLAPRLALGWL